MRDTDTVGYTLLMPQLVNYACRHYLYALCKFIQTDKRQNAIFARRNCSQNRYSYNVTD